MRPRPRYRSWLPLSTQQLRLRNLIRIEGFNIKCEKADAFIYYTLHQGVDTDAFYLSEYLPSRNVLKWSDIISPKLLKSNDQSVCVKVWARISVETSTTTRVYVSSNPSAVQSLSPSNNTPSSLQKGGIDAGGSYEKILFTWGIYFSGLIPINLRGNIKYKKNSLIFYINGDCFTSAEHILCSSLGDDPVRSQKLNMLEETGDFVSQYESAPNYVREAIFSDIYGNSIEGRYTQLFFKSCEVRGSYNLRQLLKLQETQRRQLQKIRQSSDITYEIQQQSMYCITKDQLCSSHPILLNSRHNQRHCMGRALSELFSEQNQISPQLLLYAQKLKKQLECIRSKQRLLQAEYKTYSVRIAQQRDRLTSLIELREQSQSKLVSRYLQLQIEKKLLNSHYQEQSFLTQKKQKIIQDMERRMSALCLGLREIYHIERDPFGVTTINNVPFPGINTFANVVKLGSGTKSFDNMLPMTLSVSLGYIAHLVQMIALIINRPLRNAIIHQGSRSCIVDFVKEIPRSCSEFPLYSRSTIPSKSVKYAVFLLNQNVAQLYYDITGKRCDINLTLENILQLFIYLADVKTFDENKLLVSHVYHNKRLALNYDSNNSISSEYANMKDNLLTKSHSSFDINHMPTMVMPENSLLQLSSSIPLSIEGAYINKTRVSRSVGSYSDFEDDYKNMQRHNYSNSDSVLTMSSNHI